MTALLELEDVHARYGPVQALHGVSLTVAEGEIVAVLGANGAGKTTTLRAISHTVDRGGDVRFAGRSLGRRSPEAVARLGIAHVPEGRARSPSSPSGRTSGSAPTPAAAESRPTSSACSRTSPGSRTGATRRRGH